MTMKAIQIALLENSCTADFVAVHAVGDSHDHMGPLLFFLTPTPGRVTSKPKLTNCSKHIGAKSYQRN